MVEMQPFLICALIAQTLVILWAIRIATGKITMKIDEVGPRLSALGAKLVKALDEIRAAIEKSGDVPPDVEAKLQAAEGVAQELDDLNPDS
jgi:hypothetical protein